MKKLISILGAVLALCGLLTIIHTLDTYVAKAADLVATNSRIDTIESLQVERFEGFFIFGQFDRRPFWQNDRGAFWL